VFSTTVARVRTIGIIEGISGVLLFFVAMPLKYAFDYPQAVSVVGMAHGVLWMLYAAVLLHAWYVKKWRFSMLFAGMVASVLPLGPFVFDAKMLRDDEAPAEA
jgi:integral membrane protein